MTPTARWRTSALMTLIATLIAASASAAPFSTDYTYVDPTGTNNCWAPGTYTIAATVGVCHSEWVQQGDYDGDGAMNIYNGYNDRMDRTVWEQEFELGSGVHTVSAAAMNLCCLTREGSAPSLQIYWRDTLLGSILTDGPGVWLMALFELNLGESQSGWLSVRNGAPEYDGNDFALDAVTVGSPVPEPATIILMLTGGPLAYRWAKRKRKDTASRA